MRAIRKSSEPIDLATYRARPGAVYDGDHFTPVKNVLRKVLLKEQGYLCAYCMGRITEDSATVEHWAPRKGSFAEPEQQLVYNNLLAVCPGNTDGNTHCDESKKHQRIQFNPANPDHHRQLKIRYLSDGTIHSDNLLFHDQMTRTGGGKILNLNHPRLVANRKSTWNALQKTLGRIQGTASRSKLEQLLQAWQASDENGLLMPFCDVARYYLDKRIAGC